eukprot:CAMPEP_0172453794 /NCGR_PEP_ID=MMETSP1065-20121228/10973_1 /TAXON_ID=265537 /ORGANISM="Amphiprora paludosa, Strain CCMP125" /LENGTH=67 /DNA_ID=CAMNT_0013206009 /DNA_START=70 /DNA_END=269 /DNA_ORIENTATION=+
MTGSPSSSFPNIKTARSDEEEAAFSGASILSNYDLPRLVTRNLAFHQSKNRVRVSHNKGFEIFSLLR